MRGLWLRVAGIVLVTSVVAIGQVTYSFTGGGARAAGMGKAFLGVSDDASALTWNPAGLVSFDKVVLSLAYGSFQPRGNFFNEEAAGGAAISRGTVKQAGSFSQINCLSFVAPVRISGRQVVLSAAYTQAGDDYSTVNFGNKGAMWQLDQGGNEIDGSRSTYSTMIDQENHFSPYMVNIGFGTPLSKGLDLGIALNVYSGRQLDRYSYVTIYDSLLYTDNQRVKWGSNSLTLDTFRLSGVNFTIGLKKAFEKFNVGLVFKTGYTLSGSGGLVRSQYSSINGVPLSVTSRTLYLDYQLYKKEMPWSIGAGIGYKATENLLVAADFEYHPFKNTTMQVRDSIIMHSGDQNKEYFTTIDTLKYNVFTMRGGVEYSWKTGASFAPLVPIRAGMAYIPTPSKSFDRFGEYSRATETDMSAGIGVYWSQIHLDLSYTYRHMNMGTYYVFNAQTAISGSTNTIFIGDTQVTFGEIKTREHRMNLTFTGYF